jgi:hypothetical protein
MNIFLLLSTIFISIASCFIAEKLKFKYADNIEVKNVSLRDIRLKSNAVFTNSKQCKRKTLDRQYPYFC